MPHLASSAPTSADASRIAPMLTPAKLSTATVWLQPRLRVYRQLAEYLRVMWIPIGGFPIRYLAIIMVCFVLTDLRTISYRCLYELIRRPNT